MPFMRLTGHSRPSESEPAWTPSGAITGPTCSSMRETLGWGAAFRGPLQTLEVALRNAMHARLEARYGSQRHANPAAGLDGHAIDGMADVLRRGAGVPIADQFMASVSPGFRVRLVGRGGWRNGGRMADCDRTLWRPAPCKEFPSHRRGEVQRKLDGQRLLRNRITNHEPIVGRDPDKDRDDLLEVLGWISSDVRAWVEHHSDLRDALRAPLSAPIRFRCLDGGGAASSRNRRWSRRAGRHREVRRRARRRRSTCHDVGASPDFRRLKIGCPDPRNSHPATPCRCSAQYTPAIRSTAANAVP